MKYTKSDIGGLLLDILHSEDLTDIESRIAELDIDEKGILRYARGVVWSIEDHLDDLDEKINEFQTDRRDSEKRGLWLKCFMKRLEDEGLDTKD